MKCTVLAGIITLALGAGTLLAAEVRWAAEKSTQWIVRGGTASLRGDLPGRVTLGGSELSCVGCFFAPLPGTASDLDAVKGVPAEGYVASITIGATALAAVKFDDGTFAKLAIDASAYQPEGGGQNAGVTLTSVLSAKE